MASLIRDFDWTATPLGPPSTWPTCLHTITNLILDHPIGMLVLWGSGLTQIYNDAFGALMGGKHPGGLGQPSRDCWPELWDFTAPIYDRVLSHGVPAQFTDQRLIVQRHGADEEAYFTLSYSPIRSDTGCIEGVLVTAIETTDRVHAERAARERELLLDGRNATLQAFTELTRELTLQSDPAALTEHALRMALSLLPPGFGMYYEQRGARWVATAQVGSVRSEALQAAVQAGFPVGSTPTLDWPHEHRAPYYQDEYGQEQDVNAQIVQQIQSTVTLPVLVDGQVSGIYNISLFDRRPWSDADRAVMETTVRSLGLALEGARGVAQLADERRKLQAANEELEAFAYSVSHDLRTPVRHITGFLELLHISVDEKLDANERRYLQTAENAARRMNTLIDALLDLSRTSRVPLRLDLVDLGELVAGVRAEFVLEVAQRQVEWTVGALPVVIGDHGTLHQVLVNLLSNALKYTRTRDTARIEVWAEEREREWAVFVRDNGVGFNPQYTDKLFGVFQRLHRADDFEGTGVGLANVRRVIQRHGGEVAAEGRPGEGAVFSFTLPK